MLLTTSDPNLPLRALGPLLLGVGLGVSLWGRARWREFSTADLEPSFYVRRDRNAAVATFALVAGVAGYVSGFEISPAVLGFPTRIDAGAAAHLAALGVFYGLCLNVTVIVVGLGVRRTGHDPGHGRLRVLVPATDAGWRRHFLVFLPATAAVEELLYRATIGAFAAGFGVSPWALVPVTAVLFALGHHQYDFAGLAVVGATGTALGAVYVWTGSLIVATLTHLVHNAVVFAAVRWRPAGAADENDLPRSLGD